MPLIRMRDIFLPLILLLAVMASSCAKKDIDERFSSPKKTYALWLTASIEGDVANSMECMTRASQKFMDIQTRMRDLFIERMVSSAKIFSNYSVSEERIKGNKAVVLIRELKSGHSIAVPLMYEDGGWKVDLISMFSGMVAAGG